MSSPATFSMVFSNQTTQQTTQQTTSQTPQSNTLTMGNIGNFKLRGSMFSGMNNVKGCKTCGGG